MHVIRSHEIKFKCMFTMCITENVGKRSLNYIGTLGHPWEGNNTRSSTNLGQNYKLNPHWDLNPGSLSQEPNVLPIGLNHWHFKKYTKLLDNEKIAVTNQI